METHNTIDIWHSIYRINNPNKNLYFPHINSIFIHLWLTKKNEKTLIYLQNRFWTSKQPLANHFLLATCECLPSDDPRNLCAKKRIRLLTINPFNNRPRWKSHWNFPFLRKRKSNLSCQKCFRFILHKLRAFYETERVSIVFSYF